MPATTRTLRSVPPDERRRKPSKAKAKSVRQAAATGTQRELLVAMKARVADAVENPNTPARDLAALTKRLLEIAREIEAIDAHAEQEAAEDAEVADEPFDSEAL